MLSLAGSGRLGDDDRHQAASLQPRYSQNGLRAFLNAALLACRGLVEGLGPFRGWAQLSGELGLSGTPSGIPELRPPVGTSADDPSQTWHRVRHYWNLTPALAATQHHSRLLAPARQLVRRRDQRLLPRRVVTRSCPRVIVRDHRRVATLLRRNGANQVSSYPRGIRPRQTSVCAHRKKATSQK